MKLKSEFVKRTDCIVIGKPDKALAPHPARCRQPDATLTASYQASLSSVKFRTTLNWLLLTEVTIMPLSPTSLLPVTVPTQLLIINVRWR